MFNKRVARHQEKDPAAPKANSVSVSGHLTSMDFLFKLVTEFVVDIQCYMGLNSG